jgi:signal transduction histidine kinase
MKLSLRLRVLLLLVLINAVVLGTGSAFLSREMRATQARLERERSEALVYALRSTIQPEGELNVASILSWPTWREFADAVILDRNWYEQQGRVVPYGVRLNPLGALGRRADFDDEEVLRGVVDAMRSGHPVEGVAGGRAVPIAHASGVWGGCWYRMARSQDQARLLRLFGFAFAGSTALLTASTFLFLRRFVLDPVQHLAEGARRVTGGDLSVRLGESQRRDELSDLVRTFNAMAEKVQRDEERLESEVRLSTEKVLAAEAAAMTQRRLAAMGELAAGIAHEINNPLGGLQNAVSSLARGDLPVPKRRLYLDLLQNGLERIRLTVGQLLKFTPRAVHKTHLSLREPVEDALALVRHRASRLGVELSFVDALQGLPGHGATILGEAHELAQAVLNLLMNALDALEGYAQEDRRIDVVLEWAEPGRSVQLAVRDNGPGVAAGELERVADLFYTTKAPGKGTGLGLALVHRIVASHGGTVRLESQHGKGFSAILIFPVDFRDSRDLRDTRESGER